VEIKEACHRVIPQSVDDIVEGTSDDRATCDGFDPAVGADEHDRKPDADAERQYAEAPPRRTARKPESDTFVAQVDKLEAGHDRYAGTQGGRIGDDDRLGGLIDQDGNQGHAQTAQQERFCRPHPVTPARRRETA
jgi:hypothetical protein